jgi:dTMP kinase
MKIYFGAAVSLERAEYLPLYKKIVTEIEKLGHEVLSKHVIDPSIDPTGGLKPSELFEREVETVQQADVMVAEVTAPSWGTALLMEKALDQGIPVLALFYKDNGHSLSIMIEGHNELYVDHYTKSNLKSVLKKNFTHFGHQQKITGKLVVIDGADGAGKATQTEMLLEYLQKNKIKNKFISFPRYHTSFHGQHVARFLKGEFGGNREVSPYLSSLAFALDRLTARDEMIEWLEENNIVVADRYTSANMAHQASKLPVKNQASFLKWIYDMEYKEHKLPKEDMVIFLHVPAEISQKLLDKKSKKKNNDGKRDEAEKDLDHQKKSIAMYQQLAKRYKHWEIIDCVENDELLSKKKIHHKIIAVLKEKKII